MSQETGKREDWRFFQIVKEKCKVPKVRLKKGFVIFAN